MKSFNPGDEVVRIKCNFLNVIEGNKYTVTDQTKTGVSLKEVTGLYDEDNFVLYQGPDEIKVTIQVCLSLAELKNNIDKLQSELCEMRKVYQDQVDEYESNIQKLVSQMDELKDKYGIYDK